MAGHELGGARLQQLGDFPVRRIGAGLALIGLASLPLLTAQRVGQWQDESTLWWQAAEASPQSVRPWVQLGYLAHVEGRWDTAEWYYRRAVWSWQERPWVDRGGCVMAMENLTLLALQRARWQEAAQWGSERCR